MQNKQNTKSRARRRVLIYSLMVISVIALVLISITLMMGYRLDLGDRTIAQTGLVQYNSSPRGAEAKVDGKRVGLTQTKGVVLPGVRQFSVNLTGYRGWQKTLTIKADTVTNLDYIQLVPIEPEISDVIELGGVKESSLSPNGRSMVAITVDELNQLVVNWGDLRSNSNPVFTQNKLDTTRLTDYTEDNMDNHSFKIMEWGNNSRFVMLKHSQTNTDSVQWLRLDRDNPDDLLDISSIIGLNIKEVTFGSSSDELYALQDNGDLRMINIDSAVISRPLISQVEQFSVNRSTGMIVFSSKTATNWTASLWREGWISPQTLRAVPISAQDSPLGVTISRYFNKDTITVSTDKEAYIYRGVLSGVDVSATSGLKLVNTVTAESPVREVMVSGSGRFILARTDNDMISYDIERQITSGHPDIANVRRIDWLDDFHVWTTDDDKNLSIREFDGENKNNLATINEVVDASLSTDNRYIFYLDRSAEIVSLKKISMRVTN